MFGIAEGAGMASICKKCKLVHASFLASLRNLRGLYWKA